MGKRRGVKPEIIVLFHESFGVTWAGAAAIRYNTSPSPKRAGAPKIPAGKRTGGNISRNVPALRDVYVFSRRLT